MGFLYFLSQSIFGSFWFFRFTHELDYFKNSLHIREFYPEKNGHESKVKRDYGNKAYQEGKDLDALYLYTQVHNMGRLIMTHKLASETKKDEP